MISGHGLINNTFIDDALWPWAGIPFEKRWSKPSFEDVRTLD